jgi:hypothetical protein
MNRGLTEFWPVAANSTWIVESNLALAGVKALWLSTLRA